MNHLKEREKKKNQKEQEKENHHHHPARAREVFIDRIVDNSTAYARGITRKDLAAAAEKIGASADEVNAWLAFMDEAGWIFKDCDKVNYKNFRRSLRMWHKTEERMKSERGESDAVHDRETRQFDTKTAALVKKAKSDSTLWALCRESCANCGKHGCTRGVLVPPDRQLPRPCRPEECPKFTERKDVV